MPVARPRPCLAAPRWRTPRLVSKPTTVAPSSGRHARAILVRRRGAPLLRLHMQDKQAKALFKELGYLKSALVTVLAIPRICRAGIEARRMKKRWPWQPPETYMCRSPADLRNEFGIRVI